MGGGSGSCGPLTLGSRPTSASGISSTRFSRKPTTSAGTGGFVRLVTMWHNSPMLTCGPIDSTTTPTTCTTLPFGFTVSSRRRALI